MKKLLAFLATLGFIVLTWIIWRLLDRCLARISKSYRRRIERQSQEAEADAQELATDDLQITLASYDALCALLSFIGVGLVTMALGTSAAPAITSDNPISFALLIPLVGLAGWIMNLSTRYCRTRYVIIRAMELRKERRKEPPESGSSDGQSLRPDTTPASPAPSSAETDADSDPSR